MNADRVGAWIIFGSLAVWAIAEIAVRAYTRHCDHRLTQAEDEALDAIANASRHVRLKPAGPLTAELIARGQARTIDTEWAVLNEAGGLDV